MKKLLLMAVVSMVTIACEKSTPEPSEPVIPPKVNQWKGKTIVWTGTSIPWSYAENSYPDQIGRYLEATVYNTSISGSTIVFFPPENGKPGNPGMAATWKQLQETGWSHNYSYMSRIFEYKPDLIVIDHGQNDLGWIDARLGDLDSEDVGTFYGAMNTVIKECRKKFPNAKIMLCTPPVEYVYKGQIPEHLRRQRLLGEVIRNIAKAQNVYLWDLMVRCGLTPDMQDKWTTDYVHPNQMKVDSMAKDGAKFIMEEL